jgi:hypothetical protein
MLATSSLASVVTIAKVRIHSLEAGSFQFSQKYELVIKLETAKALGPTMLPTLLALAECDMACSSSLAPLASFACWRGRSTAGPSHWRT